MGLQLSKVGLIPASHPVKETSSDGISGQMLLSNSIQKYFIYLPWYVETWRCDSHI